MPDVKHFDADEALAAVELLFWRQGVTATGIQDIVSATGLSRSSLYNAFGSKEELYAAALQRYLDERSRPMFDRLASDDRGLPAIADFFDRLIRLRCTGRHARWGCLISNAHTEHSSEPARLLLDQHHGGLRAAFEAALEVARGKGDLRPGLDQAGAAEMLTLLAYGVNLRSRSGAAPKDLKAGVETCLHTLAKHPLGF
ncbi:TetR family transcriptional regulator [Kribbella antiqua]|uniref:TetR family transcriptional regulator n=1 Tax=Kribbella antiqua TaxID=2512217 RepID=A0A4R2IFN8_9ACTN|nr:TetR/AcrR family transcriptional regulator [Kribbella antiqua]TCO42488.1 TetR family transcriptional regulator [Kribbella antiqua]